MESLADEPIDFKVTRVPYFLRPELPGLGKPPQDEECPATWGDQMDKYTKKHPEKFGGEGQPPHARFGISWQAAEVGLKFCFDQRMSNSMDALRLLQKAQSEFTPELREDLFETISRKYFAEGRKLADHDMLVEAAKESGMPTDGLHEWLAGSEFTEEVERKYAEIFYGWGFTQVPVTLVSWEGMDQCLQGSQHLGAYIDMFRKILSADPPKVPPAEKIPVWEKMSKMALMRGTPHGHDFRHEAHEIFHGKIGELMRGKKPASGG